MNNIHLYIYGSKVFLNIINDLNLGYNLSTEEVNLNKKNNPEFIVRIIFPEKLKLIEVKKYFTENIPTIFFLKDKSYLLKNKLSLLNFHQNLSLPVDILSFREILNIYKIQAIDLSIMYKIEFGDDVIAEIKRLQDLLEEEESNSNKRDAEYIGLLKKILKEGSSIFVARRRQDK